ncbi:unknown [Odoribacter sp. CAG:788]|jgi:hypothetical protein|nr:unknown [Odoribacter sp. CAG:788]
MKLWFKNIFSLREAAGFVPDGQERKELGWRRNMHY